jgi:hypothetical protein
MRPFFSLGMPLSVTLEKLALASWCGSVRSLVGLQSAPGTSNFLTFRDMGENSSSWLSDQQCLSNEIYVRHSLAECGSTADDSVAA